MLLNIYAVYDNKADSVVRFAFGNNDTSFVRDNLPGDIYNQQSRRGLPFADLEYKHIGTVDTESLKIDSVKVRNVDIEKSYQFKIENSVEKVEKTE